MKIKYIVVLLITVLLNLSAFAQTNTAPATNSPPQSIVQAVRAQVATNINEVVIQMLSGTKDAASEIYGASKTALKNSVDFVMEQAPDVVKQFLVWKFFEALVHWLIWLVVFFILLGVSFKFHSYMKAQKKQRLVNFPSSTNTCDGEDGGCAFKWIFRSVAILVLLVATFNYGFTVVEIKVAPKYYLLEYVVDQVKETRGVNR